MLKKLKMWNNSFLKIQIIFIKFTIRIDKKLILEITFYNGFSSIKFTMKRCDHQYVFQQLIHNSLNLFKNNCTHVMFIIPVNLEAINK
jgi:hypothetical protein